MLQWFCTKQIFYQSFVSVHQLEFIDFIFIMNMQNNTGNLSVSERSVLTLRWKLWNLTQSRPLHQKLQPGWWSEGGECYCIHQLDKYCIALCYSASQVHMFLLPACSFIPTECCYEFWDIEFYQGLVFQGLKLENESLVRVVFCRNVTTKLSQG